MEQDQELLSKFVGALSSEDPDFFIESVDSNEAFLEQLYKIIPFSLPRLFEQLLLNYRWSSANMLGVRLLDHSEPFGYLDSVQRDKVLFEFCSAHRFVQFGFNSNRYDPVCFDCEEGRNRRNYRIITLDHEAILCKSIIKKTQLAARFEEFIQANLM